MNLTERPVGEVPVSKTVAGGAGAELRDVLGDLFKNVVDLVEGEVKLAAAETSSKFSKEIKRTKLMSIGAFIVYAGFLFILAACVIGLSVVMPAGWAALVVGATVLLAGAITILIAQKTRGGEDFIPRRTVDIMREDAKWMRDQLM